MTDAPQYRIRPEARPEPWGAPFFTWLPVRCVTGAFETMCYVQMRPAKGFGSWFGCEYRRAPRGLVP
jgi:hypothetical protein